MKFTQSVVDKLELAGRQDRSHRWDRRRPGFGFGCARAARRVFVAQYKIGPKTRRLTLGYTKQLTVEQARKEAKKQLAKVAAGGDPKAKRPRHGPRRPRPSRPLPNGFIAHQTGRLRPSTLYATRLYLLGVLPAPT